MGTQPQHALHRTVVVVDVSAFGQRHRIPQEEIRRGLYTALESAFEDCGLDWSATHHEDRGDGVFVLVPPDVPKSKVVDGVPHALLGKLRRYNATRTEEARIRLRIAITAGEVQQDEHGVVGDDVTLAFRLLDAKPLRDALARSTALFALIVSERIFDDVIRQDPGMDPSSFRRVDVDVKEVHGHAWLHVPNATVLPVNRGPGPRHRRKPRPRPGPRKPPLASIGLIALLLLAALPNAFGARPLVVPPCRDPVQLTVATSAEKESVVRELAVDFEQDSRQFTAHGCKGVSVLVFTGPSARRVADALGRSWAPDDLTGIGAEPHVWLPDSRLEVEMVDRALERNQLHSTRLVVRDPIAQSPVVLGVSPEQVEAVGEPDRDVPLDRVQRFAALDTSSGAGLVAAAVLVHSELDGMDLDAPDVPLRLHDAARSTTDAAPCADGVALLASERAVAENEACRILYPDDGTLVLDHPFVAVEWTGRPRNERRQEIMERFLAHLRSADGQDAFRRHGFRDVAGNTGHTGEPRAGQPTLLRVRPNAAAVRGAWDAASGPKRIAVAATGAAAEEFARSVTDRLGPDDELFAVPATGDVIGEAARLDADVVVLLDAQPTATVATTRIRVVGVGFAAGACTALAAVTEPHDGECHEATGPEGAQRALEGVARAIWGG